MKKPSYKKEIKLQEKIFYKNLPQKKLLKFFHDFFQVKRDKRKDIIHKDNSFMIFSSSGGKLRRYFRTSSINPEVLDATKKRVFLGEQVLQNLQCFLDFLPSSKFIY